MTPTASSEKNQNQRSHCQEAGRNVDPDLNIESDVELLAHLRTSGSARDETKRFRRSARLNGI
jgi:hypothetical protein